jgi:hypothetical protein
VIYLFKKPETRDMTFEKKPETREITLKKIFLVLEICQFFPRAFFSSSRLAMEDKPRTKNQESVENGKL